MAAPGNLNSNTEHFLKMLDMSLAAKGNIPEDNGNLQFIMQACEHVELDEKGDLIYEGPLLSDPARLTPFNGETPVQSLTDKNLYGKLELYTAGMSVGYDMLMDTRYSAPMEKKINAMSIQATNKIYEAVLGTASATAQLEKPMGIAGAAAAHCPTGTGSSEYLIANSHTWDEMVCDNLLGSQTVSVTQKPTETETFNYLLALDVGFGAMKNTAGQAAYRGGMHNVSDYIVVATQDFFWRLRSLQNPNAQSVTRGIDGFAGVEFACDPNVAETTKSIMYGLKKQTANSYPPFFVLTKKGFPKILNYKDIPEKREFHIFVEIYACVIPGNPLGIVKATT